MFRRRWAIAALTVLLTPVASTAAASGASEPAAVGVRTMTFVDRSRSTPADLVAGITPASERRLPTTIYYPARGEPAADGEATRGARPRGGRYPIVLFAGGAPGVPADYAPLLQDWAAAGYVVVAPAFPVSSFAGPDDVAYADLPHQSGDVRFVLRRVLELDGDKAGLPSLDARRIAVAGHSLGGQTALSLVAKCCRESRVDVALVLAGVTDASDGPPLKKLRGPVLFVHARNDRAVPYEPTLDTCTTVAGWRRMLTVEDVRGIRAHSGPYVGDDNDAAIVRTAMVDFLDGALRGDDGARRRLRRVGADTDTVALSRCVAPADRR
jgi:dienelactone hydrolase